jgi:hypothetical protein
MPWMLRYEHASEYLEAGDKPDLLMSFILADTLASLFLWGWVGGWW